MDIYTPFAPTYLYIKQHSTTGKLYFGKTKNNPETYQGSGKHWKNHIRKHGISQVITLWYCLFYEKQEMIDFALLCSAQWNIVDSDEWLNLRPETGIDGMHVGAKHSDTHRQRISESNIGKHSKLIKCEHCGVESIKTTFNKFHRNGKCISTPYKTPFGEFRTSYEAEKQTGISQSAIRKMCKDNARIINEYSLRKCNVLPRHFLNMSYKEAGFHFIQNQNFSE